MCIRPSAYVPCNLAPNSLIFKVRYYYIEYVRCSECNTRVPLKNKFKGKSIIYGVEGNSALLLNMALNGAKC